MTDEELVAEELARLDVYQWSEQADAERKLLRMLPVALAAAVLREEALDALADAANEPPAATGFTYARPDLTNRWKRYLRLEVAELQRRRDLGILYHPTYTSLWREMFGGEEPDPLRYARTRSGWREWQL
jgi:hypothetical protein